MRKIITLGVAFLAAAGLYAQEYGDHIDLLGKGIAGLEEVSIAIPNWEQVEYIVAEAVYYSDNKPNLVKFSTESITKKASPEVMSCNNSAQEGMRPSVFRARFNGPAPSVSLDILENLPEFVSFSLYVHRKDGIAQSIKSGELVHLVQSEKIPQLTELVLPVTAEPRDVFLKFGVTELKQDDQVAVFTFEFAGEVVDTQIRTWFNDGNNEHFKIREVMFEKVPGKVDRITMTLFPTQENGNSIIAGVVVADLLTEYITSL